MHIDDGISSPGPLIEGFDVHSGSASLIALAATIRNASPPRIKARSAGMNVVPPDAALGVVEAAGQNRGTRLPWTAASLPPGAISPTVGNLRAAGEIEVFIVSRPAEERG